MRITFHSPNLRHWEAQATYKNQVLNGNVGARSFYDDCYGSYARQMDHAATAVHNAGVTVGDALICGVGASYEEVLLVQGSFPDVKRIQLVDWHLPNLIGAKKLLKINQTLFKDLEFDLRHDDLRMLDARTIPPLDFAFTNKVLDLFDELNQWHILKSVNGVLKPGGILFSFDYPFGRCESGFNELAFSAGYNNIMRRVYQKF